MTENSRAKLITQMKRDIFLSSFTKYFSLISIFLIFFVTMETDTNLVNDWIVQLTIVTAIYLSAKSYITRIIRAAHIQGIDIMQEMAGVVEDDN